MKKEAVINLIKTLKDSGLFEEEQEEEGISLGHSFLVKHRYYSLNLKGTKYYLDIQTPYIDSWKPLKDFYLHWECRHSFIWRSIDFFDMLDQLTEEQSTSLIFMIDVFKDQKSSKFKFRNNN